MCAPGDSDEAEQRELTRAGRAARAAALKDRNFAVFRYDEDVRADGSRWYTFRVETSDPVLEGWLLHGSMIFSPDGQIAIESLTLRWTRGTDALTKSGGLGSAQARAIPLSQIFAYERALAAAAVFEERLMATIGGRGLHPEDALLKSKIADKGRARPHPRRRQHGDNTLWVALACLKWQSIPKERRPRSVYAYLTSPESNLHLARSTCEKAIIRARERQLLAPARRQGSRDGFRPGPLLGQAVAAEADRL